jgi:uncharacterized membrane protein
MRAKSLIFFLAAFALVAAALPGLSVADSGYVPVYSNWVNSGDIVPANGCYCTFTIANGSGSVRAHIQSPGYSDQEVTISPGNSYFYYDALRIYVVELNSTDRALVDISKPASTGSSSSSGTKIYCDTPGQKALAGDKVTFPIVIKNNDEDDRTYTLTSSTDAGWSSEFRYNGKSVYQIYVPAAQSRTVDLVVETSYTTGVGEKHITASADDYSVSLAVQITSVNSSVTVSTKVGSVIASIGDKVYYDVTLDNLQSSDRNYRLAVAGLPANWYYRFVDARGSTNEMAEVVVPASSARSVVLEIVPPYNVAEGDYGFTAVVTTPDSVEITKYLALKLKGGISMAMSSDKLAYSSKPGQAFAIKVYVTNDGTGGALTNVYPDVEAPSGWTVESTPAAISSIRAGETQAFEVSVVPPANIVASDYSVKVNVKSDQAKSSSEYRITITTDSYVPYIGGAIIVAILAGLLIVYRKFGRR